LSGSTPRIYDELMPARGRSVGVIITKRGRERERERERKRGIGR